MNNHTFTLGASGSGKSTFHAILSRSYVSAGCGVLVLDPQLQSIWTCNYITDDVDNFIATAKASQSCHLIVDESGETVGRYDPSKFWLTTRARNNGHTTHIICQETNQVYNTVRNNCETAYIFATEDSSLDLLPSKWKKDERVYKAIDFAWGEFFVVNRFKPLRYGRINGKTRQIDPLRIF